MATPRIADSVGRVLGDRYRLIRLLGIGASAHVYAAEDIQLGRRVAVKILDPALAGDVAFLRRFHQEARSVAPLRHAGILRLYDTDVDAETPFLVMELLEGGSLRTLLDRGGRLSPSQAAAIGTEAARALAYAHGRGVIHRDIKPANLLFDDEGRVTIADFGLARALAEAAVTEPLGNLVGTARYAPPELVRGEALDPRADVYSLALVLVEAVTGSLPFPTDTSYGTLMARSGRDLPVPAELGPLRPVLEAAGRADPARRCDAAALAAGLAEAAAGLPAPAPLELAGPLQTGEAEADLLDPTEYPGRPRLFDQAEHDPVTPLDLRDRRTGPARPPSRPSEPFGTVPAGPLSEGRPPSGPPTPPRRRRRRLRTVVLVLLVLILLAGGAAGIAYHQKLLSPQRSVPSLVGLSQDQAASAVTAAHLQLAVAGHTYSSQVKSGLVISQTPDPQARLRDGSTVRVVLSEGPAPVAVPALAGRQLQFATGVLSGLGLQYTVQQTPSLTVAANYVISSSPDSGTLLPGQTVTLVVSSGKPKVAVPALTAKETYTDLQQALKALGLVASEQTTWSDTVPTGQVISLTPAAGSQVTVGSTVRAVVSKGPHLVTVPNVYNESVGVATEAMQAAGLSVVQVLGNPLGQVTGSYPAGGTQAKFGSGVTLYTN